jgi:membrane-associated phospholipid phosphatase
LLAGDAVVDAAVLMVALKSTMQRLRPTDVAASGNYSDTFFHKAPAFRRGHALMSVSVATVFARRCLRHRWAPCVAYSLAGVIGFSRVTIGAHFPSDVCIGAALGYVVAR